MKIIDGIGVTNGCSIGFVEVLLPKKIKITKEILTDEEIETELCNFEILLKKFFTIHLEDKNEFSKIQKDLLDDPYVKETVKKKIKIDRKNLKFAINETFMEICDVLDNSNSEYIRDRIFDYLSIYEELIAIIEDIFSEISNFNPNNEKFFLFVENLSANTIDRLRENLVGIVSTKGGKTSHASLYAKSLGIPYIICKNLKLEDFVDYKNYAILDCDNNFLILDPTYNVMSGYKSRLNKQKKSKIIFEKPKTKNNTEIGVLANITSVEEYKFALSQGADGCGLFRTEFLYMGDFLPTENYQFTIFKKILELSKKPVTIRTFDIGADKISKHFSLEREKNPFLGVRGFRIYEIYHKEFKKHIRAILRASAFGKIKIMIPMITTVEEVYWIKNEISKIMDELKEEKISFDENIEFGIMVETPSSVMLIDILIREVDFVSIGTNDLTQYMLACDREHIKLQKLYDAFNPAIVRSILTVTKVAHGYGKKVSVCGDFASKIDAINLLLLLEVDEISVTVDVLQDLKKEISKFDKEQYSDFFEKFSKFKKGIDILNYLDNKQLN